MCFGGTQPAAPINRPAYAPEDAHKHFEFDSEGDSKAESPEPEETRAPKTSGVPRVRPDHDNIRM